MEDLVTVATFNFTHDLYPVKIQLEHAGIVCFVKDEYTVQVNPYLSAAVGGVKLQVMGKDYDAAMLLLKEIGYLDDQAKAQVPDKSLANFDKYTSWIPFMGKIAARERVLAFVILGILLFFLLSAIL